MSADTFASWLRTKFAEQLHAPSNEPTNDRVTRLLEARRSFGLLAKRLGGTDAALPLWGAIISQERVPGLQNALGAELAAHLVRLDAELRDLLAALVGATAPRVAHPSASSWWDRVMSGFAAPALPQPVPAAVSVRVDQALARHLSGRLPGSLWLSLLSQPELQAVLLDSPPIDADVQRGIEARLEVERDEDAAVMLVKALHRLGSVDSIPVLRAVLGRAKSLLLRAATITALVKASPDVGEEFSNASVADRLAVIAGYHCDLRAVRWLADPAPEVVAAASASVATGIMIYDLAPPLVELLDTGKPQAQRAALALFNRKAERLPDAAFAAVLRAATGGKGAVREDADALLARLAEEEDLSEEWLAELSAAIPRLTPESPAVVAITRQVESARGELLESAMLAELEAPLEQATDENAWLVFADALTAAGDPRGALVVLSSQGKELGAHLEEHQEALLGALPDFLEDNLDEFLAGLVWRHGFIQSATLRIFDSLQGHLTMQELVVALLWAPSARFLSELRVGPVTFEEEEDDNDYAEVLAQLGDWPHRHLLRRLVLGELESPDELNVAPWGDLSSLWAAAPALEELTLRGSGGQLGAINAPALRALTIEAPGLDSDTVEAMMAMHAPRLERLVVSFGEADETECGLPEIARLLSGAWPGLQTLGLKDAEFTPLLIPVLAGGKLLPRIKQLDLSLGSLNDGDADLLLRHARAFAHLERFDLSQNRFAGRVEELQLAFPRGIFEDQRELDE